MSEVDSAAPPVQSPPPPAEPAPAPPAPPPPPPTLFDFVGELVGHASDLVDVFATAVNVLSEIRDEVRGLRHATELLTVTDHARNGYLHGDQVQYQIGGDTLYGKVSHIKRGKDGNTDPAMLVIPWENGQVGTVGTENKGLERLARPLSEPRAPLPFEDVDVPDTGQIINDNDTSEDEPGVNAEFTS